MTDVKFVMFCRLGYDAGLGKGLYKAIGKTAFVVA
jgi:hypothetical protein